MIKYIKYKRIARLIVKEFSEAINEKELTFLETWLNENPENKKLYHQIRNSERYKTRNKACNQVKVDLAWENVLSTIKRKNKQTLKIRVLKYAAIIFFPLLIGGIILFLNEKPQKQEIFTHSKTIEPGSSKATLTLNSGKSIFLDKTASLSIIENDGTIIQKKSGVLNYTQTIEDEDTTPLYNTITIPRGGEFNLMLSDGTRVYLNSMSTFKYPVSFTKNTREVELRGEAYFEVTENIEKPFIVKTKKMSMEVLGTAFNVNAYDDTKKVITTLVEGKVKINASGQLKTEKILSPTEQAIFNITNETLQVKKVNTEAYTAWKNGELIFYDDRLEDIMSTLTRWYSAEVFYKNSSVKDLRFSGYLDKYKEIDQILDIIASTGKVNIDINEKAVVFSEP